MIISDNILSPQVFNCLCNEVFSHSVPWYHTSTSFGDNSNTLHDHSFFHMPISDGQLNSQLGQYCYMSLLIMLDKLNVKIDQVDRARLGLLEPKLVGKYVNRPHIDKSEDHYVGLLYLNDSDGETIIYNEKYDVSSGADVTEFYENNLQKNLTIRKKVECKANRFVMFDGLHYHSSTCPTNVSKRIALNFNFTIC